jgi:DNA helicase HerA-like ATPase
VQPIAPGANVSRPSSLLLRKLLGDGDLRLGRMRHHPEVGVWVRSAEILTKHLAVLGMTGSGKSNGVKHLLRELAPAVRGLRVFVVDTHGEYAAVGDEIDSTHTVIDVSIPDKIDLLDAEMVRGQFGVDRMTAKIKSALRAAGREPDTAAAIQVLLHAADGNETLQEIAAALDADPTAYCFGVETPRVVLFGTGQEAVLEPEGLYVLDLRATETFAVRSKKCAVLADHIFQQAKVANGDRPSLLVVDEAHNYIPERTTGYMAEAARHGSLGALTTVAVEGRKFNVGLIIASQRPSRIAKDVLAQMNSQLIFRLANLEDLGYVRESFEAAGTALLGDLPTLDTGVCLCAGTMIAMPVRCDVPLFAHRERWPMTATVPSDRRAGLADVVRALLPEAQILADEQETVVFADPRAEVSLRTADGTPMLEVTCTDGELAARIRDAVTEFLLKG